MGKPSSEPVSEPLLTIRQAAARLNLSERQVWRLIKANCLSSASDARHGYCPRTFESSWSARGIAVIAGHRLTMMMTDLVKSQLKTAGLFGSSVFTKSNFWHIQSPRVLACHTESLHESIP